MRNTRWINGHKDESGALIPITLTIAVSFYFLLPIRRESIVFDSNFRSGDFDGLTRFEVP